MGKTFQVRVAHGVGDVPGPAVQPLHLVFADGQVLHGRCRDTPVATFEGATRQRHLDFVPAIDPDSALWGLFR